VGGAGLLFQASGGKYLEGQPFHDLEGWSSAMVFRASWIAKPLKSPFGSGAGFGADGGSTALSASSFFDGFFGRAIGFGLGALTVPPPTTAI